VALPPQLDDGRGCGLFDGGPAQAAGIGGAEITGSTVSRSVKLDARSANQSSDAIRYQKLVIF
jgi:hypothetical protein